MGSRAHGPGACPAPWWGAQPAGPRPDKRSAPEEPDDVDPVVPVPEDTPESPAVPVLMLVLAPGCALKVVLDDIDLVLEPEPTSVLQVCLGGRTLVLVPEALVGAGAHHSLQPGAFLGPLGEVVATEQGAGAGFPENDSLEQAWEQADYSVELLLPWADSAGICEVEVGSWASEYVSSPDLQHLQPWPGVPTPSPERSPYFSLSMHLQNFPSSPLQPLPPSPNPSSPARTPERPLGPHRKARRCLFPE